MKKLLITTTIIGSLISSIAFAKTEGNYIGIDVLATQVKDTFSNEKETNIDVGLGLNYKYAINFNHFFVAPGAYFNYNNASVHEDGQFTYDFESKLKYSYGLKVDLGYDITDKFAAFTSIAYQENRIEYDDSDPTAGVTFDRDFRVESFVYGIGTKYSINTRVDVNLAYEYVDYKNQSNSSINPDVIKIGLSYKF